MSNKKILIISYYWPPSGGVGVQRWLNYAIQLKERGWEPIIYTPENPQFEIQDLSLLDRIKDIRVVRKPIWEPFQLFHRITGNSNRKNVKQGLVLEKKSKSLKDHLFVWIRGNLFVPDPRKYWIKPSAKFLEDFIRVEKIDTVISTGPPHSMHLIGLALKRRLGVKWIADFRDPWSKWDIIKKLKTGQIAYRKHRKLEGQVLTEADRILTVSADLHQSLSSLGGGERVRLLYNGVSGIMAKDPLRSEVITIGYYGMLNELRNPSVLWETLNELAGKKNINLRIGGVVAESIQEEILALENLKSCTDFLGYLSHEEVKEEYARCNILVLLLNRSDNAKWILPVKFFEYLASRRLILAVGPVKSELQEIAKDVPTFKMIDFEDKEGMRKYFDKSEIQEDFSESEKLLKRFSHANLVTDLESVLTETNE